MFVQSQSAETPAEKKKRLHEKAAAARAEIIHMATEAAERMSPGSTKHIMNATLGRTPLRPHPKAVAAPKSSIAEKLKAKERRKHEQERKLAAVYALIKAADDFQDD